MQSASTVIDGRIINRLAKQQQQLTLKPLDGVIFHPDEDGNVLDIQADMIGPKETPFHGGLFRCKLVIEGDFPNKPPKGYFLTKIFHPNVAQPSGEICVSTLKKDWDPVKCTLRHIFQAISHLFVIPYPESALNEEAGRLFMENYDEYYKKAKLYTEIHARPTAEQAQIMQEREEEAMMAQASEAQEPKAKKTPSVSQVSQKNLMAQQNQEEMAAFNHSANNIQEDPMGNGNNILSLGQMSQSAGLFDQNNNAFSLGSMQHQANPPQNVDVLGLSQVQNSIPKNEAQSSGLFGSFMPNQPQLGKFGSQPPIGGLGSGLFGNSQNMYNCQNQPSLFGSQADDQNSQNNQFFGQNNAIPCPFENNGMNEGQNMGFGQITSSNQNANDRISFGNAPAMAGGFASDPSQDQGGIGSMGGGNGMFSMQNVEQQPQMFSSGMPLLNKKNKAKSTKYRI